MNRNVTNFVKSFSLLILLLFAEKSHAQFYGNEWINFGQPYYKISVTSEGIYKIDKTTLLQAGLPLASISPRNIQIFHHGREQAITVEGETDGVFNDTDYILFYGQAKDGKHDAALYKPVSTQPHDLRSVFSDTSAYFLTWNIGTQGKRMKQYGIVPFNVAPAAFHLAETHTVLQREYTSGRGFIDNEKFVHTTWFGDGEGWTGDAFERAQFRTYSLNMRNATPQPIKPKIKVVVAGRNAQRHRVQIAISSKGIIFTPIDTITFQGNTTRVSETSVDSSFSTTSVLQVRITALGDEFNPTAQERVSVSAVQIVYPQTFNMNGLNADQNIRLLPNNANALIQWQNLPSSATIYDLTTEGAVRRIGVDAISRSGIDSVENGRRLMVSVANKNIVATQIKPVAFRSIDPNAHNYLIVSHKKLMQPSSLSPNAVREYANYRASVSGGDYDTLVVDVEQLFNQFSYGEYTPMAIRRFASFMLSGSVRKPEYLFFIGKGIEWSSRLHPNSAFNFWNKNLVPIIGEPASDIAYTFGLNGMKAPAIATGRIAAETPAHIMAYLDKVKAHEQLGYDEFWRKNLVHVSGGISQFEIDTMREYIRRYKQMAEGQYLGGKVKLIYKTTSATVEPINVAEEANKGISVLNIFGHASIDGPDMDIGLVSAPEQGYLNEGKYPLVIVNGCVVGNIFSMKGSLNENWVLTPKKGAIAFLAHCDYGTMGSLDRYTSTFYKKMFADSLLFGESIGKIQQQTCLELMNPAGGFAGDLDSTHMYQIVLHADPAVAVLGAKKPDYKTTDSEVKLITPNVSAATSLLKFSAIVSNYGKAIDVPIKISVRRTTGNGTVKIYPPQSFTPVFGKDTFELSVEDNSPNLGGLNTFEVMVDAENAIDEIDENNNIGRIQYFVPQTGLEALYPKKYSIVNTSPVQLIAQATNLLVSSRSYEFQIDTSASFNSPLLQQQTVQAKSTVRWQVNNFPFSDSTVYFWRVKFSDDTLWQNSSFIYIANSPEGWSQSQFFQFSESTDEGVNKDYSTRRWKMPSIGRRLRITAVGSELPSRNCDFILDNLGIFYSAEPKRDCSYEEINYVPLITANRLIGLTLDGNTLTPELYAYSGFKYWEHSCGRQPSLLNFYHGASEFGSNILLNYFREHMSPAKKGFHTILMSAGNVQTSYWSNALKDSLVKDYGINRTKLETLPNGTPFIIIARKGAAPNSARFITFDPNNQTPPSLQSVAIDTVLQAQPAFGTITSTAIGPAIGWGKVYFAVETTEASDRYTIQLIGVTRQGKDSLLVRNVPATDYDISSINAADFPFLKLRMIVKDSVNFTPPILKKWQVIYNGVPEGTLNMEYTDLQKYVIPDQPEGTTFSLPFVFENISPRDFYDSLRVTCEITGEIPNNVFKRDQYIKPLISGDTVHFMLDQLPTRGFVGNNSVKIFVNSELLPEEKYTNNFLTIPFKVYPDQINPVLDVAFDGVRIMDGDLVSPSPLVSISLQDENRYMLLNDTANMIISLKRQCATCLSERINFGQAGVRVFPATTANQNRFRVEYQPQPALADGRYTLEIKAKDISENSVGRPYSINFEVVSQSSVTHFYPYPNPFSTSTRFVFTLTGSEIPEDIKIQIMTVSGKVVREITRAELGNIRIGNNITSFAWDGTDEYGDKLANGVYLYRVIMQQDGQDVAHRETSADQYFKHGFGKMYIMR